ncbi:MAG: phosphodiester glycosidase family protein [Clostridiales bacterium]|nr:phosphodiester glycosidase family protein [Clostridiales bacterium]
MMQKIQLRFILLITLCLLLFSACIPTTNLPPPEPSDPPLVAVIVTPEVTATPKPTPTPEPTPTPTPTPVPTPSGLCGGRYDVFTDGEVIWEDNAVRSDSIAVFYSYLQTDNTWKFGREYIHMIDIYLQNIEDFQAADWPVAPYKAYMPVFAREVNALAAISGDFHGLRRAGLALRNGVVIRDTVDEEWDICVVYRDGTMKAFGIGEYDADILEDPNIWQLFSFGPILFDESGEPLEDFPIAKVKYESKRTRPVNHFKGRNPRMALGYYEPGHYIYVFVEGGTSTRSSGMRLSELARFMKDDLGCSFAYNLDGGTTSRMWWNGAVMNQKDTQQRYLYDLLFIAMPPMPTQPGG